MKTKLKQKNKIQKQNVGNAGEYYIASRLSEKDFTVTITLGRAEKYDILALGPKGKLVKLSVKTTQLKDLNNFPLSEKDEKGQSNDFFYAFVKLNNFEKEPDFWIIPSNRVCYVLKLVHKKWLKTLDKKGNKHTDSSIRLLDLLHLESREVIKRFYPKDWQNEVKKYYKNLNQLL
ncbi:MAG: hypothetical protein WDK96_02880 [Candidatus Paceibacterota bacterium]|jgi:hypothetical protein